jgi:hypothetical protein
MSLSRRQWEEMWKSVKYMEQVTEHIKDGRKELLMVEISKMKTWIQTVIGQME